VSHERDDLIALLDRLGPDEVRVLYALACRLEVGAGVYGPLHLRTDLRDFGREASEEALDLAAYAAMQFLKVRP
jgi:hypothetical protein